MTPPTPSTPRRISRRRTLALLGGAVALVACGDDSGADGTINLSDGGWVEPSDSVGELAENRVEGEPVNFWYQSFDDATKVSFEDFASGPVVLNFFASWCPTCIAEMPDFETVSQNMASDVTFLGLAVNDRVANAVELVGQTGVTYPVANDPNGVVFAQFGGLGMPTTVFINADRTVADVHTGVLDVESLTDKINTTLLT